MGGWWFGWWFGWWLVDGLVDGLVHQIFASVFPDLCCLLYELCDSRCSLLQDLDVYVFLILELSAAKDVLSSALDADSECSHGARGWVCGSRRSENTAWSQFGVNLRRECARKMCWTYIHWLLSMIAAMYLSEFTVFLEEWKWRRLKLRGEYLHFRDVGG